MTERFVGWGRTAPSFATRAVPRDMDELVSTVAAATPQRGILVRGLGRSYGDAAQNAGGTIIDLTGWTRVIALDTSAATISVESGASIDQIMRLLLPHGLWLPVIPGTRQVTIGGAISADVHGKNHHARGSFGHHVLEIDLLTAQGELLTLRPQGDTAELFWATVGGMGLTGVITRATLSLTRVESSFFAVDTQRVPHIRELIEMLASGDDAYEYSVAWFDTATSGNALGRAVLTRGRCARVDELPERLHDTALDLADEHQLALPFALPRSLVNRLSSRAFNALWFAKAPPRRDGEIQSVRQFLHPLDAVRDWNHVYGPRGFVQYQFVVPFGAEDAFVEAVQTIADSPHVSSLNVLKRFGEGSPAPLSFPMPGWTAAVDFPVKPGLHELLNSLDALVIAAGGRVYLAKDARLSARSFEAMYPRAAEFRRTRDLHDPEHLFRSDLSRRLAL